MSFGMVASKSQIPQAEEMTSKNKGMEFMSVTSM